MVICGCFSLVVFMNAVSICPTISCFFVFDAVVESFATASNFYVSFSVTSLSASFVSISSIVVELGQECGENFE